MYTCGRSCHTATYLLSFVVPFSLALFLDLLLQVPSALWCFPQPLPMPNSTHLDQPLFSIVASSIFSNIELPQPTTTFVDYMCYTCWNTYLFFPESRYDLINFGFLSNRRGFLEMDSRHFPLSSYSPSCPSCSSFQHWHFASG